MKTDRARLLRDLATLVRTLPDSTLAQLATELEELSELPTSKLIRKLTAKAPAAGARVEVMELLNRWHQLAPDLASDRLGWALRAAAEMDRNHRERQRLELVWTGLLPEGAVLRRTAQALLEVITLSRQALLLVTYAAYDLKVVAERRAAFSGILTPGRGGLELDTDELRWWTFAGGRINATLRHALQTLEPRWKIIPDNLVLKIRGDDLRPQDFDAALARLRAPDLWEDKAFWDEVAGSLPGYRLSKFQPFMPPWVEREVLSAYLLDVTGAWSWVSKG